MMRSAFVLGVLVLVAVPASAAQRPPQGGDTLRIQRLAGLGRAWGYAKYFHPALAYRSDIDWDAALIGALPRVRAARNAREYATAVQGMLDVLGDPLTRVQPSPAARVGPGREFGHRIVGDSVLMVTAGDYYSLSGPRVQEALRQIPGLIARARAVVFDLRSAEPTDQFGRLQLAAAFAEVERLLVTESLPAPGQRRRVYHGFEAPSVFSSGQYQTGYFIRHAPALLPVRGARALPVVFLVNEHSGLPSSSLPLQAGGRAAIVYEGEIARHTIGEAATVPLGEGLTAQVRRSEAVFPDGTSGEFRPDAIVPYPADGGGDPALARAEALAKAFAPVRAARRKLPASVGPRRERSYPEMRFPDVGYRLLAAVRIWNAIEYFYPYRDLLDHDWAGVLADVLPAFEAASTAREYGLAVAAIATKIQDSHAYVAGPAFTDDVIGAGYPPIRVRMIEGIPVVTALIDSLAARAGVAVGDEVLAVDGRPAAARLAEIAGYLATSTPQSSADRAALHFMNGAIGAAVTLTLRDGRGRQKTARLERRHEDFSTLYHRERGGDIVRMLPGNVGYVDLDRLTFEMVGPMFSQLRDTKAIIFDMRGYPNGTIWAIAPRLTDSSRVVARFGTPMVGYRAGASMETFTQTVEPSVQGEPRYRGRTIMLIDERSVSQAEHTGLYLKAAHGTLFVGSRTAGADGEITSIPVPGGLVVGFTGQAVTFPDGRQVQRVGLTPDVEVHPTVAGIRAGIDEVLEAARRISAAPAVGPARGATTQQRYPCTHWCMRSTRIAGVPSQ